MGAPYHKLLSKLDRALVAYILNPGNGAQGVGTAVDVLTAKRSQSKTLPGTICYSQKGDFGEFFNTGTGTCQTSIMVRTSAPEDVGQADGTAKLASDDRVGKTFDLFFTDLEESGEKLGQDITAAARAAAAVDPTNNGDLADFTVINVMIGEVEAGFDDEDAWVDTLNLKVVCAPSNVS